jgi:succinate-acetate transporter protein
VAVKEVQMTSPQVAPPERRPDGGSALAETVLTGPEHGRGYFYPDTAGGTPLGLFGFASSLALLSMANAEWFNFSALIIVAPASIAFGAVALILAGIWDFRGGNGFAATWETAYGCFWLFLGLQLAIFGPRVVAAAGAAGANDALGAYLLIWAVITAGFTAGTYFVARPAFVGFGLLAVIFVILGVSFMSAPGDTADTLRQIGGWAGIVDALIAFYVAFAIMMNALLARAVVPLWAYPYKKT